MSWFSFWPCGLWEPKSGCKQGLYGKHLHLLVRLADPCFPIHYVIFPGKVVFRFQFKKKITLGPIPTTFTIKWLVHVFSELNSPQSIFSIPLPCQLRNPFPVFLVVTLVTSLGWMLNPIQRELTIFFQVVQMFWSPPPPHSFSKDQWLCTCGVRTALAMFSLLECLQTRTPEL